MNRPHQPGRILPTVWVLLLAAFAVLAAAGRHSGSIAQAQWTTNGNDINSTNSGKVGVGTTTPSTKLDVVGVTKSEGFNLNNTAAEKSFVVLWNNGVANQKVQVYWPSNTQVDGVYEITVTGHYWYSNSNGGIRKRIVINGRNIGVINMQQSEVPFRLGFTGNSDTISDIMWDAANSRYYLIVSNLDNAQNAITIHVKSITPGQTASNADTMTVTPIYTTDATVYPQLQTSIMGSNVGIGTNTPGYKLDVQGGQLNASGGLCIAGDCKTAWSQVGGASSQWTTAGTSLFYNTGSVGIGTTTPGARLDVGAGAAARGSYTDLLIGTGGNNPQLEFYGATKSSAIAHDETLGGLVFYTNGPAFSPNLFVGNGGNVGVGTTTPAARLHVAAGGARVDGTYGRVYLGTGAVQGGRGLEMVEENATTFSIRHHDPSVAWQNIALNPYGGNIGIGTLTPRGKLEVAGGPLFLGDMGNASWGNMIVRGRVISSSSNIHLSPPTGAGVYINSDYREAGGAAGPVTLNVSGNITGAGFCLGTDCKTAWSQVGGGTSSQWATNGANISYSGGNVGIGNSAPGSQLFVGSGAPAGVTLPGLNVALGPTTGSYVAASNGTVNTFMGSDTSSYGIVGTLSNHPLGLRANNTLAVTVATNGNVGVGTQTPAAKLDVQGDIKVSGNINAKYQDVAEWVPSTQKLSAGTVVILDPSRPNHVLASTGSYDTAVAGVISARPGIALGEAGEGKALVATTGRVKVRVDASRGPIRIGDLLVTSDVEGFAMKSEPVVLGGRRMHAPGTIIGKALETLESGTGEILVLLSLQ